jgi:hypothetical protein
MGASINDLARWLRLNINKGSIDGRRIISEAGAAAMQRVQAPGDPRAPTIPGHKRVGYGLGWFIGTFHDRPIFEHGGGYTGAAAHISILPEDKLGVAVISNTGGAHTDIIAADIYNRLLDKQTDDPLPRLKKLRKQRQERMKLETDRLGPNPAKEGGLSLAAEAYAGRYEHEDWGAVRLELQDSELVGTLGDLKLRFGSSGKDQFKIDASLGELMPGRFELDGAQVMAIIFHAPDVGEVRLSGKP